jgi:hypothetical protein
VLDPSASVFAQKQKTIEHHEKPESFPANPRDGLADKYRVRHRRSALFTIGTGKENAINGSISARQTAADWQLRALIPYIDSSSQAMLLSLS